MKELTYYGGQNPLFTYFWNFTKMVAVNFNKFFAGGNTVIFYEVFMKIAFENSHAPPSLK